MPPVAVAWRLRDGNDQFLTYRCQIDECSTKSDIKIFSCFDEKWSKAGEIYYPKNESKIGYIFQRVFKSEQEWQKWAKHFPYSLKEISSISSRIKSVSLGTKSHVKVGKPKGRRCGKCGELGHNARTCKGRKVDKSHLGKSKILRKHRKKCSICNQFDHNARTCANREKNGI